jgi:hypothetical protein
MLRKPDPELVKAKKAHDPTREVDPVVEAEHKQWLNILGKADLGARLHHEQPEVEKALKKVGIEYSTKELAGISRLAKPPRKQDVVLFTRMGKVVGYSVGATPANSGQR